MEGIPDTLILAAVINDGNHQLASHVVHFGSDFGSILGDTAEDGRKSKTPGTEKLRTGGNIQTMGTGKESD